MQNDIKIAIETIIRTLSDEESLQVIELLETITNLEKNLEYKSIAL